MPHMQPFIEQGEWYLIDGPAGTEYIPCDIVGHVQPYNGQGSIDIPGDLADYCENKTCWQIEKVEGFGARLSAPGYLDCTEWSVFETEEEAKTYLAETYDLCPDCLGELDEDCVCHECNPPEDNEPIEGDITSSDHVHWYQYGKLVLTTADPNDKHTPADDYKAQLAAFMNREQYWPNVWWISDHGNAHLITMHGV